MVDIYTGFFNSIVVKWHSFILLIIWSLVRFKISSSAFDLILVYCSGCMHHWATFLAKKSQRWTCYRIVVQGCWKYDDHLHSFSKTFNFLISDFVDIAQEFFEVDYSGHYFVSSSVTPSFSISAFTHFRASSSVVSMAFSTPVLAISSRNFDCCFSI